MTSDNKCGYDTMKGDRVGIIVSPVVPTLVGGPGISAVLQASSGKECGGTMGGHGDFEVAADGGPDFCEMVGNSLPSEEGEGNESDSRDSWRQVE